jgi:hypothetical protein
LPETLVELRFAPVGTAAGGDVVFEEFFLAGEETKVDGLLRDGTEAGGGQLVDQSVKAVEEDGVDIRGKFVHASIK